MEKLVDEHNEGKMTMKQLNSNASFLIGAGSETLVTLFVRELAKPQPRPAPYQVSLGSHASTHRLRLSALDEPAHSFEADERSPGEVRQRRRDHNG